MTYDATLQADDATLWAPASPRAAISYFGPGEGIALGLGGLAIGAFSGAFAFFGMGRIEPLIPLTAAVVGYAYAIYLAARSWQEVILEHELRATALFGLHLVALLAWPLLIAYWTPASWLSFFSLAAAFIALALFLLTTDAPASAVYRSSAHVFLVAAIGVYQGLWASMTFSV